MTIITSMSFFELLRPQRHIHQDLIPGDEEGLEGEGGEGGAWGGGGLASSPPTNWEADEV